MELTNDQQILQTVVKKAWEDPVFKTNLVQNPVGAIEHLLGHAIKLPKGKKIAFIDQTDTSTIFINIPPEPNLEDMELNEEQLEVVAGGGETVPTIIKPHNYDGNVFIEG